MILTRPLVYLAAISGVFLLANCATKPTGPQYSAEGKLINPHPPGTYEHFTAEENYPKTFDVWKDQALLDQTNAGNSSIIVSLSKQRAFLMNGDKVVMDYPISSGIPSRPTPPGTYYILEKTVDKHSNKYGRIYDAEGNVVNSDADSTKDPIPEGGKFVGAAMPYWMRMSNDGIGHHIGPLPKSRRAASHACIRGPRSVVPTVFSKVKNGTRVVVVE